MATIAHRLSLFIPRPIAKRLQPKWHFLREAVLFMTTHAGRYRHDGALHVWFATRPFGGRRLDVAVRSYRELRRYLQFGQHAETDALWHWMHRISDCEVLYDVGSANGLEGLLVNHLHGSKVVFIEPFTPSIESILKSVHAAQEKPEFKGSFEVVHAAIDEHEGYQRLYMHEGPLAGSTGNSFALPEEYCRGGRGDWPVLATQWVKSVSLDSLREVYGMPSPTHVKMDVDGFENRAMRGARNILKDRCVHSWGLEITGDENIAEISAMMEENGYVETGRFEHYPGAEYYTADFIYVRDDLAEAWKAGESDRKWTAAG